MKSPDITARDFADDVPGRLRNIPALIVLSATVFLVFYNTTVVTSIEAPITASLSLDAGSAALFTNITSLAAAPLILLAGHLGDRMRRRSLLLSGLGLLIIGSVGTGLSLTYAEAISFRVVQGIGSAFIIVLTLGLSSSTLGPRRRGLAIAIWATGVSCGLAAGPLIGAAAASGGRGTWRWAFIGLGIAAAVMLPADLLRVREEGSRASSRSSRIDWAGTVMSIVMLVGIVTGITEGSQWGWGNWKTILAIAGGAGVLIVFGWSESRRQDGLLDMSAFRRRSFSLAAAIVVLELTWTIGSFIYVGLVLGADLHAGLLEVGLLYLPMTGTTALLIPLVGQILDRVGFRPLLVLSGLCAGSGFLQCQFTLAAGNDTYGSIVPGLVLLGIGAALAAPVQSAAIVEGVPGELAAQGSAINAAGVQVGSAIGAGLIVSVFGGRYGPLAAHAARLLHALGPHNPRANAAMHNAFTVAVQPAVIVLMAVAFGCTAVAAGISTAEIRSVRARAKNVQLGASPANSSPGPI